MSIRLAADFPYVLTCVVSATFSAGVISCLCGSTLRILLEFLLPKDGSLVAFGTYALQYGKAIAGLPTFMEVTPEGNSSLVWNPDKDTCQQGENSGQGSRNTQTNGSVCVACDVRR